MYITANAQYAPGATPEMEDFVKPYIQPEQSLFAAVLQRAMLDFLKPAWGLKVWEYSVDRNEAEAFLTGETPRQRERLDFYCQHLDIDSDVFIERVKKIRADKDLYIKTRRLVVGGNIRAAVFYTRRDSRASG